MNLRKVVFFDILGRYDALMRTATAEAVEADLWENYVDYKFALPRAGGNTTPVVYGIGGDVPDR